MRGAAIVVGLLLLAGCGRPKGDPEPQMRKIDCALAGATDFAPRCQVEQAGDMLIVHEPDGAFRRFRKVDDGRGVVAADGMEDAHVAWVADGVLEVTVGQDRFRFPAKLKPDAPGA